MMSFLPFLTLKPQINSVAMGGKADMPQTAYRSKFARVGLHIGDGALLSEESPSASLCRNGQKIIRHGRNRP